MQSMDDEQGVMARVREGMHVVDAAGEDIGTVEYFEMGNPEAATTAGNQPPSSNLVAAVAEAVLPGEGEPDVPEPLRSRLRRTGFIKIDGPGLFERDRYVSSEKVSEVAEDRVRLAVRKAQLASEV